MPKATKREPGTLFVGANVPSEIKIALDKIASDDDRPLSSVIRLALQEYIERKNGNKN